MRKVCKRTAALLLVVCLLLPMIPAALAATSLTYEFRKATATTLENNLPGMNPYDPYIADVEGDKSSSGIILDKTANQATYLNNSYNLKVTLEKNYTTVAFNSSSPARGDWYAIQIDGVSAGTYDMSFYNIYGGGSAGKSKVYVVKKDAYDRVINDYVSKLQSGTGLSADDNADIFNRLAKDVLNAGNEGVIDSQKNGLVIYQSIGLVKFPETGNETDSYVLMFQSAGASLKSDGTSQYQSNIIQLNMTPVDDAVAAIYTGTAAPTFPTDAATAITAIEGASDTAAVKVIGNLQLSSNLKTAAAITVNEGATLDLNGNNLTAASVACMGTGIVKDSEDGTGLITVTSGAVLNADSTQLALYDSREGAEGYRVYDASVATYKPTFKNGTDVTEGVKFLFTLKFTNKEAYGAIATGESGLAVKGTWSVNEQELSFPGEKVKEWASAQYTAQEGQTYALYVIVTGMDDVDSLTITPKVGALSAAAITYSAQ